jgi:F-type H+-transporting ATPase subunit delta
MAKKFNARRYAQAVFEIATEKQELERWQIDLRKTQEALEGGPFLAVLESPKISTGDKYRLLEASLGDVNPLVLNLIKLLITRGGIGMVGEIISEYQRLRDEYYGIQTAAVVTAVPLDDKDREKLSTQLGAMTDKKVVLESSVDPAILGGIVARVGGKLLDGSTRSKLVALKKELASGGI